MVKYPKTEILRVAFLARFAIFLSLCLVMLIRDVPNFLLVGLITFIHRKDFFPAYRVACAKLSQLANLAVSTKFPTSGIE